MQADIFFLKYKLDLYIKKRKFRNSRYPTFLLKCKYKAFQNHENVLIQVEELVVM